MLTVVFRIDQQLYGISAAHVYEIVLRPGLVALAGAPPLLKGLLNLRGRYLPVLDGGLLVDANAIQALNSHVMVLGRAAPELALLVDHVADVHELEPGDMTALIDGTAARFLSHVVSQDTESILLCDMSALLAYASMVEQATASV